MPTSHSSPGYSYWQYDKRGCILQHTWAGNTPSMQRVSARWAHKLGALLRLRRTRSEPASHDFRTVDSEGHLDSLCISLDGRDTLPAQEVVRTLKVRARDDAPSHSVECSRSHASISIHGHTTATVTGISSFQQISLCHLLFVRTPDGRVSRPRLSNHPMSGVYYILGGLLWKTFVPSPILG